MMCMIDEKSKLNLRCNYILYKIEKRGIMRKLEDKRPVWFYDYVNDGLKVIIVYPDKEEIGVRDLRWWEKLLHWLGGL